MPNLYRNFLYLLFFSLLACQSSSPIQENKPSPKLVMKYDKPAQTWMTEALPIGNGYMGMMFFGDVAEERLQFTEESLWAGGPGEFEGYNGGNKPEAYRALSRVRKLLLGGQKEAAHAVANKDLTGQILGYSDTLGFLGFGAQQAFGDIFVETEGNIDEAENYQRELDLEKGIGRISYQINGHQYQREYFGSYEDRVIVARFSSEKEEKYSIRLTSPHKNTTLSYQNNILSIKGSVANNGMEFEAKLGIKTDGKDIVVNNGVMTILKAKTITLILTAATDYVNQFPTYKGNDYQLLNKEVIESAIVRDYEFIKNTHLNDYQRLFSRVSLDLGENEQIQKPIPQRIQEYASGIEDPALEALYFQFGRYLLISSSRPGTLPANLQGKWNNSTNPPWACDYHMNINLEMNYWLAEPTNLSECHVPLINYIDKLREPGRVTAQSHFRADGWTVNTMNNIFGFTAPGWDFPWGYAPGSAAWLSQHVWEHYAFTKDEEYLKKIGYPIMKEAAAFWEDYLMMDHDGTLVSVPSYSPEHGGITAGCSMDQQFAWDLLTNCIEAGKIFGEKESQLSVWQSLRDRLSGPKIGQYGQLQEWKEDLDDPENKHRHISHLFALHPGKQISPTETPDLAEAAKVTLGHRGDGGTGWSIAWKINFWARLLDGDYAHKMLKTLLRPTHREGVEMMNSGGTYDNLFCAHPPFQIDGNFGGTAGITEMLLQSHAGEIHLLPALPSAWGTGSVLGLKARGDFEVSLEWEDGQLTFVEIQAGENADDQAQIRYGEKLLELDFKNEGVYKLNGDLGVLD